MQMFYWKKEKKNMRISENAIYSISEKIQFLIILVAFAVQNLTVSWETVCYFLIKM